ncbi:MAG: hypothetical protein GX437_02260 [Sphingobacteriales bacterium]|nr:hypothetical protein [Sphingobacteriales bacterium]
MRRFVLILFIILPIWLSGQKKQDTTVVYKNSVEQMLENDGKLQLGGYGEVHFNKPYFKNLYKASQLDVHRLVLFYGYNFSHHTQFVSEIEFEYAKELWIEQAFLQHRLNKYLNLRAGLLLIPMGIINETHEPVTFNGVERPVIDNKISLSTWREIGTGFWGSFLPFKIKYQIYITGGLNGYDGKAVFNGANPLRDGRQKGSKAYTYSPALSSRIEYFGFKNLHTGISFYSGNSQSKLYSDLNKDSLRLKKTADSSVIGIRMIGADFRYFIKGFQLRGQFYFINLSNTDQYNTFRQSGNTFNNLGKQIIGYYLEAGYNVLRPFPDIEYSLIPFFRYEFYNLHHQVEKPVVADKSLMNTILTAGISFRLNDHAIIKSDFQWIKPANVHFWQKYLNFGFGVTF